MGIGEIGVESSRLPLDGPQPRVSWRARWPGILFGALFALITTVIMIVRVTPADRVTLEPNDVSTADIHAPLARSYISGVLTQEERRRAELAVADVYDEPQTSIRNRQVARAREVLDYIGSVRADAYASAEDKVAWIRAIPDISLGVQAIGQMLNLDDAAWLRVTSEVPVVVNRAMREEIRENQLAAARARVESLIGLQIELSDQELEAVTTLSRALLQPNTFFNAEKTEAARQKAREAVEPVVVSFAEGEIIVRAGDIVDAVDVEALEELGLSQAAWDWWEASGTALFVLVLTALIWGYLFLFAPWFWEQAHWPPLLVLTMTSCVLLARLMIPLHAVLPYFFPLAALAMLLGALADLRLATLVTLCFGLIIAYLTDGAPEITTYAVAGALVGAFSLGRGERFASFARAGAFVALSNVLVLVAFRLPAYQSLDVTGMLQLGAAALANGLLAASVTLLAFFLLGTVFGITTSLQLIELSRLTHPLLKMLIEQAPGSYYHAALISNLAERAANAIGADGALARVGAFYHDIGKVRRPPFFAENQMEGMNPYDRLDPHTSAQIVMSHVKDGLALAQEYRLPTQVRAFISQHHGTRLVSFFYNKALKEADGETVVREEDYRYPGPKPQTRETAIVMLADGCEAAVRANRPASAEGLEEMVRQIISQQLLEGQLDESNLTLRDLDTIRQAFVEVLRGVHHPRIRYPEPAKAIAAPAEDSSGGSH